MSRPLKHILDGLNLDYFYFGYLKSQKSEVSLPVMDLSVGELDRPVGQKCMGLLFSTFASDPILKDKLTRYNGTAGTESAALIAAEFETKLHDMSSLNEFSIIFFDGAQDALFAAIHCGVNLLRHDNVHPAVVFPVPSYPYWTSSVACGALSVGVEARSLMEFLDVLEAGRQSPAVIIINVPNNPLGYGCSDRDIERLNKYISRHQSILVVDSVYASMRRSESTTKSLKALNPERTVYCDSASKILGLPGLRLGILFGQSKDLITIIRAFKSAQSLLPSVVKSLFFEYLMRNYPEYVCSLRTNVQSRFTAFASAFLANANDLSLTYPVSENLMYQVIDLSLLEQSGLSIKWVVELLESNYSLRVSGNDKFYPGFRCKRFPSIDSAMCENCHGVCLVGEDKRTYFIRLSFGRNLDMDTVAAVLARAFKDIAGVT